VQPYGSPWAPPPPPPQSRFPWLAVFAVVIVLLLGFAAIAAGAVFFLVERSATAPVATTTWTPPPPTPTSTLTVPPTVTPTPTPTFTAPPAATASTVQFVPIAGSPVRGPDDALVTLVEFSDFQCPFCKRAEATLTVLRAKYGRDLRVVWKNEPLPFHVHAMPAAEVALEARHERGDTAFWAVHDELYASAPDLEDATLLRVAGSHGVSTTSAKNAIDTSKYALLINADTTLASSLGATGTPTFFINGKKLVGAQPASKFEAMIDDALLDARARVAKGTPRDHVYDEIMASAAK